MRGRWGVAAVALAAIAALLALGIWQIERLQWKRALIARVERRLASPPVAAPGPSRWATIGTDDAYTRISATGRFRGANTFVQAVTAIGTGYWVLTPLDTGAWTLLVNRGFVPAEMRRTLPPPPGGTVRVTGLLRVTEPGGAFLRTNDARADRWYSRDVIAIAARRGVRNAAPYFLDAEKSGEGWPRGGLTVVRFPNNHLVYALTWFGLAGLIAVLSWRALRPGGPR